LGRALGNRVETVATLFASKFAGDVGSPNKKGDGASAVLFKEI